MEGRIAPALLGEARERAGLSQAELARRAGVSRSVLSVYESGRRQPSSEALARILAAAGFQLGLRPSVRHLDDVRAGRILEQVLELAEALPGHRRGALRYPPIAGRTQ
ncbi:MAG TPA: helix-turn-helix transcriptional regulator [Acidimicrobiia bacterium]